MSSAYREGMVSVSYDERTRLIYQKWKAVQIKLKQTLQATY